MAKRRLTERQKERISAIQEKRRQRVSETDKEQDGALGSEQIGTIISHHGRSVIVEDTQSKLIRCSVRQNLKALVCGDSVVWQPINKEDGDNREETNQQGIVTAIQPRSSLLARQLPGGEIKSVAANVDQIVIMVATKPALSEPLIDRYLVNAEITGIKPVIIVNKIDLLDEDGFIELKQRMKLYSDIGYPVLFFSVKQDIGINQVTEKLNQKTSILVGQSGVGKSSLVKQLLPEQEITIGKLGDTDLGKHTTTTSVLYHLPCGGNLIDSPGVRDFGVWHIDKDNITKGFVEFKDYQGKCKFRNCSHTIEPECAFKGGVESGKISQRRLESYLSIVKSIEENHS
ncbi:MAG: small ribosomal subunit biogenesis GTPase RsgA [Gammaproteobacteria bacterium]|nr:small ribosomal subunit biogenesis GTPase RsgA [Gammaproteobacteria bacterium]